MDYLSIRYHLYTFILLLFGIIKFSEYYIYMCILIFIYILYENIWNNFNVWNYISIFKYFYLPCQGIYKYFLFIKKIVYHCMTNLKDFFTWFYVYHSHCTSSTKYMYFTIFYTLHFFLNIMNNKKQLSLLW